MENEDYGISTMHDQNANIESRRDQDTQEQNVDTSNQDTQEQNVATSNQDNTDSESDTNSYVDPDAPGVFTEGNPHANFKKNLDTNYLRTCEESDSFVKTVNGMIELPEDTQKSIKSLLDQRNKTILAMEPKTSDPVSEKEELIRDNHVCDTLFGTVRSIDLLIRSEHEDLVESNPFYNISLRLINDLESSRANYSKYQFNHISFAENSASQISQEEALTREGFATDLPTRTGIAIADLYKRTSVRISDLFTKVDNPTSETPKVDNPTSETPMDTPQPEGSKFNLPIRSKRTIENTEQGESSENKKPKTDNQAKGSLIDDFADPNTEMPDYFGGGDD